MKNITKTFAIVVKFRVDANVNKTCKNAASWKSTINACI